MQYPKLLAELGWETLQERRSKHKLVIFYKIINGLTPSYLSDLIPPLVSDTNPYNLRNSDNIQPFRTRTNIFFNSFFPSTIRAWNNLSEEIRNSNTVNSFKNNLHRSRLIPQNFSTPVQESVRFSTLDCVWNAAHLTHIYMANISSHPLHVHAAPLRVHIIIFSTVQDTST